MEEPRGTAAKNNYWPALTLTPCLFILLAATWPYMPAAFNVDTKHPIVYPGPSNSHFGYSVTFGQDRNTYWLLVGAPKANQTHQPTLVEPGAIYQCGFTTGMRKTCADVMVDRVGNVPDFLNKEPYHNLKDGGWLGVSLDTNSDRSLMVACGHRWEDQLDYQKWLRNPNRESKTVPVTHANGICYTLTPDLNIDNVRKYIPLLSYYDQVLQKGIPNYAFGMAGMSAHFPEHPGEVILGAPGVYIWDGNVVSVPLQGEFGDQETAFSWGTRNSGEPTRFAYFGYSVSSGKFTSNDRSPLILVGAPRQRYRGKVFLVTELRKNTQIRYTWDGENMGEYFGASVCATDLNGDRLADVIIGAPLYTDILQPERDQGKVYISLNRDGMDFAPWLELYGSSARNSRFGSAVSCIGDLDMDDLNDIAVGAPYEDDGAGAVYIYYGHRRTGIAEDLVQKLSAGEIDRNLRGFGISIAKSLDVDRNAFSDLGIGSYSSDHAVILRTRPVILPNVDLKTQPEKISIDSYSCDYGNTKVRCFKTTVCFSYTTKSHYLPNLDFEYTLTIDEFHKGEPSRGKVVDGRTLKSVVNGVVNVNKRRQNCTTFTVNLRVDIRNYLLPVYVSVKTSLMPCSPQQSYFDSCPVVHPDSVTHIFKEVAFLKGCKNGEVCESDLQLQAWVTYQNLLVRNPTLRIEVNKTVTINAKITNSAEHAYLTQLHISIPWKLRLVTPKTCVADLSNSKETFRNIICEVGNPLTSADPVILPLVINVDQLSWTDTLLQVNLTVKTGSNEENLDNNRVELQIPIRTEADVYVIGRQSDEYISYANFSQSTVYFTHNYTVINAGPATLQQVQVKIQVPQKAGEIVFLKNAFVNGRTLFLGEGKWYPLHDAILTQPKLEDEMTEKVKEPSDVKPTVDGTKGARVTECRGASTSYRTIEGDDRDSIIQPGALRRKKRDTNQKSPRQRGFTLNCTKGISCLTIDCDVSSLYADDSVGISIKMEVGHEDLDKLKGPLKLKQEIVDFTTHAHAYILNLPPEIQPPGHKPDDYKLITSLDSGRPETEHLQDWIIPVCIVAGFLLLLLIALILYMIGFFKRQQLDTSLQTQGGGTGNPDEAAGCQNPNTDEALLGDEQTPQS